jgi:hypothetical protein
VFTISEDDGIDWYKMKLFTLTLVAVACLAQTAPPPEPETYDIFYALPKDQSAKLVSLERQQIRSKTKVSGFIVMGMKDSSEITGGRSRVRFAAGQPIEFVVRSAFAVAGIDPNTFYALRLLHNKKDKREIIFMMGHATPIGASTSSDLASGVLPVEFSKYGKSSYKVTTPALKPGEYALGGATMPQVIYCFGVD